MGFIWNFSGVAARWKVSWRYIGGLTGVILLVYAAAGEVNK